MIDKTQDEIEKCLVELLDIAQQKARKINSMRLRRGEKMIHDEYKNTTEYTAIQIILQLSQNKAS